MPNWNADREASCNGGLGYWNQGGHTEFTILDENENSVVSLDGQAKLYVYADDGTLCDNYDLHIARLDMDALPVEYDENLPRTVSYDYSVRKADAFQIDLTPGNYEFVLTDPSGQEPSEIEYLRILENDGLKGYPFYPGFKNSNDPPFEPSGEHQYRIFYDALTWEEAKAACEAKGGHLATITSEEEQQKLNLYNAGNHKLWIGGYKNTEGQWCWVTGEPWKYENWGEGEPNNSSNVVADESCVAMWPENGMIWRTAIFTNKAVISANGKRLIAKMMQ